MNIGVPIIGIVLASQRPRNPIGWLFLAAGLTLGLSYFGQSYGVHALVVDPGSLPAGRAFTMLGNGLGVLPLGVLAFLFLLFPTGHLPSPRWRPVAWFVGCAFALVAVSNLVYAAQSWDRPYDQAPSGNGLLPLLLFVVPLFSALTASLAAVVVRFRGSAGDERLQLKWFATASAIVFATFVISIFIVGARHPDPLRDPEPGVPVPVDGDRRGGVEVPPVRDRRRDQQDRRSTRSLAVFITLVYVGLVVGVGTLVGHRGSPFSPRSQLR